MNINELSSINKDIDDTYVSKSLDFVSYFCSWVRFILRADVLVEYTLSNLIHYVIDDMICSVERFILVHVGEFDLSQLPCM